MKFKKEELIKSPLNYTGGKFKLLPQILPLFPNNIDTFYDLFCGGCNVGVNVKANKIICNDIINEIISLYNLFKEGDNIPILSEIYNIIDKYQLSDSTTNGYEYYHCNSNKGLGSYNKDKFLKLRKDYNKTKDDILFYTFKLVRKQ